MRKSGFTLVEVLIVIIILAIMWAVVAPQFQTAREAERRNERDGITITNILPEEILSVISKSLEEGQEVLSVNSVWDGEKIAGYTITTRRMRLETE